MAELVGNPEFERRDPELEAISDRLGELCEQLGFVETPAVAQARAAFLRGVPAGGFDRDNPDHLVLLDSFHQAAEDSIGVDSTNEFEKIGYQLAVARLWFDADDPNRFYDRLDVNGETGVVEMLYRTPGCQDHLNAVYATLDQLEALNTDNPA